MHIKWGCLYRYISRCRVCGGSLVPGDVVISRYAGHLTCLTFAHVSQKYKVSDSSLRLFHVSVMQYGSTAKPVLADHYQERPLVLNDRAPRHGSFLIQRYLPLTTTCQTRPHNLFPLATKVAMRIPQCIRLRCI